MLERQREVDSGAVAYPRSVAHDDPQSDLEAKFSMPYTVSHAVVHREVGLSAFEGDALTDSTVRGLLESVTLETDTDQAYDDHGATVIIEMIDGERYEKRLDDPPGSYANPLSDDELRQKFQMCAVRALESSQVTDAWKSLDNLRSQPTVANVVVSVASSP